MTATATKKPPAHTVLVNHLDSLIKHLEQGSAPLVSKSFLVVEALVLVLLDMHIPDDGRQTVVDCFGRLVNASRPYHDNPIAGAFLVDLPILVHKIGKGEDFDSSDYLKD